MTNLILASAILAASLAAEPAKPAAPAAPAQPEAVKPAVVPADKATKATKASEPAKAAEVQKEAAKVVPPVPPEKPKLPARPEALKDAIGALLGPCSPEMADAKLTGVEVLDGKQLNALRAKEKSDKPKADPAQRFIKIAYEAGDAKGTSVRQISTHWMLTTEQAQKLLGEKVCVFQE